MSDEFDIEGLFQDGFSEHEEQPSQDLFAKIEQSSEQKKGIVRRYIQAFKNYEIQPSAGLFRKINLKYLWRKFWLKGLLGVGIVGVAVTLWTTEQFSDLRTTEHVVSQVRTPQNRTVLDSKEISNQNNILHRNSNSTDDEGLSHHDSSSSNTHGQHASNLNSEARPKEKSKGLTTNFTEGDSKKKNPSERVLAGTRNNMDSAPKQPSNRNKSANSREKALNASVANPGSQSETGSLSPDFLTKGLSSISPSSTLHAVAIQKVIESQFLSSGKLYRDELIEILRSSKSRVAVDYDPNPISLPKVNLAEEKKMKKYNRIRFYVGAGYNTLRSNPPSGVGDWTFWARPTAHFGAGVSYSLFNSIVNLRAGIGLVNYEYQKRNYNENGNGPYSIYTWTQVEQSNTHLPIEVTLRPFWCKGFALELGGGYEFRKVNTSKISFNGSSEPYTGGATLYNFPDEFWMDFLEKNWNNAAYGKAAINYNARYFMASFYVTYSAPVYLIQFPSSAPSELLRTGYRYNELKIGLNLEF